MPVLKVHWPRLRLQLDGGYWWVGSSILAVVACPRCEMWVRATWAWLDCDLHWPPRLRAPVPSRHGCAAADPPQQAGERDQAGEQ